MDQNKVKNKSVSSNQKETNLSIIKTHRLVRTSESIIIRETGIQELKETQTLKDNHINILKKIAMQCLLKKVVVKLETAQIETRSIDKIYQNMKRRDLKVKTLTKLQQELTI